MTYSVSQLTNEIKRKLEGEFPQVDVEGEISGWKVRSEEHTSELQSRE